MKDKNKTFSWQVKDELSLVPCPDACCQQIELATAYAAAAKMYKHSLDLSTSHQGCADRLAGWLGSQLGLEPARRQGRDWITLRLNNDQKPALEACVQALLSRPVGQAWPLCCRQALLRALFLVSGSLADPAVSYHLELAIRRDLEAAAFFEQALSRFGYRWTAMKRPHYDMIYLREGQDLANYLLTSGAHQSLLAFESLRVEKEVRNTVNRVVNCDQANMQRMANAAARASQLWMALEAAGLAGALPDTLRLAAQTRHAHPDLSLKELGTLMEPPLGKSGMNHRLKRFEEEARKLLQASDQGTGVVE